MPGELGKRVTYPPPQKYDASKILASPKIDGLHELERKLDKLPSLP